MKAAVRAGADACYVGGDCFSARAFAGNFNTTELIEAIDYCHINHVKLYMAVNTLLKSQEISGLADYIRPFYKEGIDGVIVQDVGVIKYLSEYFPDLPLHGSTQMSISSAVGAAFLKNLGLTRIVPARELSLQEITAIKEKIDIEIETFIHGAMCFAYSGKCLLSSFAGGRSGNRGRCAQPCRKAYSSSCFTGEYALSMKDMCTLPILDKLIEADIDSFKIEGRMKKPEYVAATVQAYAEVRNAYLSGQWSEKLVQYHTKRMMDIYNRGGFSTGYYESRNGKQMLANKRPNHTGILIGKVCKIDPPDIYIDLFEDIHVQDILEIRTGNRSVELTSNIEGKRNSRIRLKGKDFRLLIKDSLVYRTRNHQLLDEIDREILEREERIPVFASFSARKGEPFELTFISMETGVSVSVHGDVLQQAKSRPVTKSQIIEKLSRTGGTGIDLHVEGEADPDIFINLGSLNQLRRTAISRFQEACVQCYRRPEPKAFMKQTSEPLPQEMSKELSKNLSKVCNATEAGKGNDEVGLPGCTVYVNSTEQFRIINKYEFVDNIIVEYNVINNVGRLAVDAGKTVILSLPYVFRESQTKMMRELLFLSGMYDGILVKNMDEFAFLIQNHYHGLVVCDPFLYAYNNYALDFYRYYFKKICFVMPAELTREECMKLDVSFIYRIYGHQALMVTAQCFSNNYLDTCGFHKSGIFELTDDKGNHFYSSNDCDSCYSVIYNGVPTDIVEDFFKEKRLRKECFLLEFTVESAEQIHKVMDVLQSYLGNNQQMVQKSVRISDHFTRGHYIRGID